MFNEGTLQRGDVILIGDVEHRVVDVTACSATVERKVRTPVKIRDREFEAASTKRFTIGVTSGVEIVRRRKR